MNSLKENLEKASKYNHLLIKLGGGEGRGGGRGGGKQLTSLGRYV